MVGTFRIGTKTEVHVARCLHGLHKFIRYSQYGKLFPGEMQGFEINQVMPQRNQNTLFNGCDCVNSQARLLGHRFCRDASLVTKIAEFQTKSIRRITIARYTIFGNGSRRIEQEHPTKLGGEFPAKEGIEIRQIIFIIPSNKYNFEWSKLNKSIVFVLIGASSPSLSHCSRETGHAQNYFENFQSV